MSSQTRVSTLRARLSDEGLDAVLVSNPLNVEYLSGFEGIFDGEDAHAVVVTAHELLLYTDSRYATALRTAAVGTPWEVRVQSRDMYSTLCADLVEAGIATLAIEETVPYGRFRYVCERFSGNVEAVDQWVEEIRQTKDAREIESISAAQEITDHAFAYIIERLEPDQVERDIALELEVFMRRAGSDGVAFPPIVASGPNSALPHARASARQIGSGEFVKLDFGARVDGYCADMTRTVVIGRATERHREIHAAVLAANLAGIATVKAGIPGTVVDAAARSVLEERGFGEFFGHGVGHGVGLAVHELPTVGPRGSKSLGRGSVITIEPGVYIPDFGGVRIEDLVVVEESGARVLTRSTKDLLEL